MKTYQGLFIYLLDLNDEAVAKAIDRVRNEIGKLGGRIVREEPLGRMGFARRMRKKDAGQYFRIAFELDPAGIVRLKARFKLDEEIFRVQIVNVDENELAAPEPPVVSEEGAAYAQS